MKKITLALIVLLFAGMISAEKITEFPDLMKPRFIKTDGDDFLVCEGHTFRNFSLKSRKLKYQVKDDKLYCLVENQDEIWELHSYDIK